MSPDKPHVRIKDVAEKSGCSIGTVDRVIHNRGRVSEPVRQRILEVIDKLGYHPNVNARVLASKHILQLGILLPSYREGDYWELPSLGISEAMERFREQGYRIHATHLTHRNSEEFQKAGKQLLSADIDGLILSPASYRETLSLVRSCFQQRKPIILIDSDIYGLPSLTFIGKDPIQSGQTIARLIHQLTKHIQGVIPIWVINLSRNLDQMYALLARESGFMNYFSAREDQEMYRFSSFDIQDRETQKEVDHQMEELLKKESPRAIYVTSSKVYKVARSLKKLKPEPKPLLIGHDLIRANMELVREETIDFLIEEEARRQGNLAVESMVRNVIHKEEVEKKQLMNMLIYTRENLPPLKENLPHSKVNLPPLKENLPPSESPEQGG